MGQGSSSSSAISAKTKKLSSDLSTLKTTVSGLQTKVTNFNAKSIDYTVLSGQIVNNENITKIIEGIIKSPDKLASALVPTMIKNTSFVESINQNFLKNGDFAESVAKVITSNPTYKSTLKGDKGEPGSLGNLTSIKSNLFGSTLSGAKYPATLWCADDEYCQLPPGNKGIEVGLGGTIRSKLGNLNMEGPEEFYVLNRNGMSIGRERGGNGTLRVQGDASFGGRINANQNQNPGGDFSSVFLKGDNGGDGILFKNGKNKGNDGNPGTLTLRNDAGDLNLTAKGGNINLITDGKIFAGGRDILAELDQVIRKDRTYGIRSGRGGFLSDQTGWKNHVDTWERMTFEQL